MAKSVVLTPIANKALENLADYLFTTWGLNVLENFLALYEAKILLIAEYPKRYPYIHQPSGLRKAVLTKHNVILYREGSINVEIISVFDTRQNPDNIENLR